MNISLYNDNLVGETGDGILVGNGRTRFIIGMKSILESTVLPQDIISLPLTVIIIGLEFALLLMVNSHKLIQNSFTFQLNCTQVQIHYNRCQKVSKAAAHPCFGRMYLISLISALIIQNYCRRKSLC